MSDFLCLRFRDTEIGPLSPLAWSVLSPGAQIQESGYVLLKDLQAALPEIEGARRSIVIVPTDALLLTGVELPVKQHRHIRQVLPFLVEEQIIDPIESMHLATPVLHAGDQVSVAAIKRDLLSNTLEHLQSAGIEPDYLFADVFCVPRQRGQWQLLFDDNRLLFREGDASGMSLDADMAESVLRLAIARLSEQEEPSSEPQAFEVVLIESANEEKQDIAALKKHAADLAREVAGSEAEHIVLEDDQASDQDEDDSGPDYAGQKSWPERLGDFIRSENIETCSINYSETVSQLLSVCAVQSVDRNLNILQGEFRPANANAENRRYLRKVSVAVAACIALFLLVTLGGGAYFNYQADRYFDKSVAIYRTLFPKQRKVIDPVKQMKRQLKGSVVGGTTSDFLPLLDAASRSLAGLEEQSNSEAEIKQLRYDIQRGHISIDLHTDNIDELESYRDLLANEGLEVDILSANQDGDTVKGRIQVGRS